MDKKIITARILEIEKEQKRRKKEKLNTYNRDKVHAKQIMFHKSTARNRWVFGGNRSGKTECGAVETVWRARGIHPYQKNSGQISCWVVSLSSQVQRDVAQGKILQYLPKRWIEDIVMMSGSKDNYSRGIIDYILVKNISGNLSKIGFRNCDQGREKFQGASLDFVWFDEEPPLEIYEECRMRVLDKAGLIFGTMTPLKGLTWVYDKIFLNESNDPDVWHIFMEWADNPYLPSEEIESLTNSMSADELRSRRYGQFMSFGGMVYSEFDVNVHVIEPFNVPYEWYDQISIDPGLNNPTSVHWYALDGDGNVYVIAEHYEAGKDIDYHAERIKSISDGLNWHRSRDSKLTALIDSAANQRTLSSSKSVAELFYEKGINVNTKVNKELFSGISRVKSYLKVNGGKPRLFIFKTCVNMIREFKSYWWGSGDTPKRTDDHALDELRYYIASKPAPKTVMQEKSIIAKHKEKLIKNQSGGQRKHY